MGVWFNGHRNINLLFAWLQLAKSKQKHYVHYVSMFVCFFYIRTVFILVNGKMYVYVSCPADVVQTQTDLGRIWWAAQPTEWTLDQFFEPK